MQPSANGRRRFGRRRRRRRRRHRRHRLRCRDGDIRQRGQHVIGDQVVSHVHIARPVVLVLIERGQLGQQVVVQALTVHVVGDVDPPRRYERAFVDEVQRNRRGAAGGGGLNGGGFHGDGVARGWGGGLSLS